MLYFSCVFLHVLYVDEKSIGMFAHVLNKEAHKQGFDVRENGEHL